MFRDLSLRIFLIHLLAFIAGTVVCAAVNLWLTPSTLWFPWVLIGWGAAVATHAFALLLRKTRRRERIFIDRKARSFAVHLFAYLATVLILFFVNVTVTPKVWWFFWVALGWGAGIVAHGWCAFGKRQPLAVPAVSQQSAGPAQAKDQPPQPKPPRTPRQRKPKA
jgi:hypothetical protein